MVPDDSTPSKYGFTGEEWKLLRHLIYVTFIMVAAISEGIKKASIKFFLNSINEARLLQHTLEALGDLEPRVYPDPLHRKLLTDIGASDKGGLTEYTRLLADLNSDPWKGPQILERARAVLKGKQTSDEYQRFAGSLLISALKLAKVSGPVTEEEAEVLTKLNHYFELDRESTLRYYEEYEEAAELVQFLFSDGS